MSDIPFLYPNVTSLPGGQRGENLSSDRAERKQEGVKSDFDHVFETELGEKALNGADLSQIRQPLKFSAHASQRLNDRKIHLDAAVMSRVNEALDKAAAKGIEDTLVLTNDAALIVSVKNRTVITAMDRASMNGNVFTNIDGAVIV